MLSLNDTSRTSKQDRWIINVDGSAIEVNKCVGLAVTCLEGTKLLYALKYTFLINNNELEYEAILAGLKITRVLNIRNICILIDFQEVAGQINGEYEAKEDNMQQYMHLVSTFLPYFTSIKVEHIPRKENLEA